MPKTCCKYFLGAQQTNTGELIYGWAKLDALNSTISIQWLKIDGSTYTGVVTFINKGSVPQTTDCCFAVSIMCAEDGSGPILVFTKPVSGGLFAFKFSPDGTLYEDGIISCTGNIFSETIQIPNDHFGLDQFKSDTITVTGVNPENYYVFSFLASPEWPSQLTIHAFVSNRDQVTYELNNLSGIEPMAFSFTISLKQV